MDSASRWIGALTQRARVLASLAVVIGGCVLVPQASATYPAHNGRIAFSALADGQYQIYTVRPNGHDLRQVTQVDGAAVFPDW